MGGCVKNHFLCGHMAGPEGTLWFLSRALEADPTGPTPQLHRRPWGSSDHLRGRGFFFLSFLAAVGPPRIFGRGGCVSASSVVDRAGRLATHVANRRGVPSVTRIANRAFRLARERVYHEERRTHSPKSLGRPRTGRGMRMVPARLERSWPSVRRRSVRKRICEPARTPVRSGARGSAVLPPRAVVATGSAIFAWLAFSRAELFKMRRALGSQPSEC